MAGAEKNAGGQGSSCCISEKMATRPGTMKVMRAKAQDRRKMAMRMIGQGGSYPGFQGFLVFEKIGEPFQYKLQSA